MKYYFIGIKGSGMSTLANILYDFGNSIIGYDDCLDYKFTMEGLNKRNIKIYSVNNLPSLTDDYIACYTAAINESHPEVRRVKDLGLKIIPYHELIGSITKTKESICVCGTHGKTTSSFMIASILDKAYGCSYFVGDGTGHGDNKSDLFVLESCEYNKHFLSYYPDNVVITNIELDHTETYPNIESMIEAYQEFIDKTEKKIVAFGDDLNIRKLKTNKKIYYYGFNDNNDLIAKNKTINSNYTCFDVYYENEFYHHFEIPLFGNHMINDSLAAIMIGILYGVSKDIISDILKKFHPAKRRFTEYKVLDNVLVDDYAHHPTEIRVTYDSVHQKYPLKKVIAVFLPNTYSRTEALFDDFVSSLSIYDKAYIMDIKSDREKKEDYPNISSTMLIEKIPNAELISIDSIDKLLEYNNTVLCFMSCANISNMVNRYLELKRKND